MRVGVLGPVVLDSGTGPTPIGGARLRALLARLALDAGRPVRPEVLVDALWGAAPPADEANALQTLVSRLRRVLGDPALLTSDATGYRLAATVDVDRFTALARSGRQLLADGNTDDAAATLREALELWRGPALADMRDAPFAAAEAERLERARLAVLEDRIDADLALGGPELGRDLVPELESLTADHPLRERLHAQLIRALAAAGRPTEALATYQLLRERLADAFGSDPGPLPQAAHLAVLRGEQARRYGNLTAPLTSFVGRAADVSRIVALLDSARLVTLVGPGGAGKTRLATTAGQELTAAGGVWFVPLAPSGAQEVPAAVLDVLRAREVERPAAVPVDLLDRIVELLAGDDVVVVLDNCEHVVDAVAELAETLLGRCPRLRVLATSREPLRIAGEHLHPVPPLELPEPGATTEQARDRAAIRLFGERAAAVRPDFSLGGAALESAIEICRRLDGLPLAIELAAARLRTLPIEVIADRLDDRFRLLTGGSRTALPRHRTLHAVVAWSWDLLSADERTLLERLSVVPGSCTEDAARAIGGFEAGELLMALADKSLLQPVGAGEPRYRMLETIREYGLDELAKRREVDAVRARHAAFFLELAETADPHLRTRDQLPWLARLVAERDNLLAALRWTIERGDGAAADRFGAALCWFWSLRGDPPEAVDLLGQVLVVTAGPADPQHRALVVAAHALGTAARGRSAEVEAAFGQIAAALVGIDTGDHPLLEQARMAAAIAAPDRMPDPFPDDPRERTDPWHRASGLLFRGQLARYTGDVAAATDLLSRALTGFEELGERWGTATALSTLEPVLRLSGDLDAVRGMHERATRCFRELGMEEFSVENETGAALVRAEAGDVDGARLQLECLLDAVAPAGSAELSAQVRLGLAQLEWRAGRPGPAREHGLAGMADTTPPHLATLLLGVVAQADAADGRPDDAARTLDHPAVHLMLSWDTPIGTAIAVAAAGIELSRGRPGGAGQLLGVATTLRGADDVGDVDARRIAEQATQALGAVGFATVHAAGAAQSRTEAKELVGAIITS